MVDPCATAQESSVGTRMERHEGKNAVRHLEMQMANFSERFEESSMGSFVVMILRRS